VCHLQGDGRAAMTLGELVMGQALHDLRLVFADVNEHTCSTLPDSLSAALELLLEPAAGGADTVMAQMLRLEATQVKYGPCGLTWHRQY